jgi:hypothetical protein
LLCCPVNSVLGRKNRGLAVSLVKIIVITIIVILSILLLGGFFV